MSDVEIIVKAIDLASPQIKLIGANFDAVKDKVKGIGDGLTGASNKIASFASGAKNALVSAGEAWNEHATTVNQTLEILGKVGQAAQQAYAYISEGTQLARTEQQFDALAGSIGTTSDALLQELSTAVRGTVSNFDLMRGASSLVSLGLTETSEDTVRLTKLIGRLGWDMNQVTLTLANQSTMRLDALGLSVTDVEDRAKALEGQGYATDEAFKFAIIEAGETKLQLLGDAADTTAGKLQILEANAANVGDSFKKTFSQEMITNLNAVSGGLFEAEEGASKFGATLAKLITNVSFAGFIRFAKEELNTLAETSRTAEGKISGMGGVVKELPPVLQSATRETKALADVSKVYRDDVIAASTATDGWMASLNTVTTMTPQAIQQISLLASTLYQETSPAYAELQDKVIQTNAHLAENEAMVATANARLVEWGETIPTVTGYIAQSAEALAAYNAETGDYITQALQADDLTINMGDAMYNAADAAGAEAAALVGIKLALGEITPAQAEYLLQQAAMAAKATEFGEAIAAGTMTISEAVTGLQNFSASLSDNTIAVNYATGSVTLLDESITASSASTQNLLDKMGLITDVNATVTIDTGDAEARVSNLYNKLREIGDPAMPTGGGGSPGGASSPPSGGGGNIPQFAEGGSFIVPPGYPSGRPGMPIGVHSGEQVNITPAGQPAKGGNTYNLYVTAMDGGANVGREFSYLKALAGG